MGDDRTNSDGVDLGGSSNPPGGGLWLPTEIFSRSEFESDVRQLENFRRSDFRKAMLGELSRAFKHTGKIQLRHLALVSYYCEIKARQYVRDPLRELVAGSDTQARKLAEIYRRSKMNARLLEAQQRAWACNSVVLSVHPGRQPQKLEVQSWIPADVMVYGDPDIDDIREADRVEIRVPVRRDPDTGLVWYGRRVYTTTEAYVEYPGGKRRGLFNSDMSNPVGYPPLVAVRLTTPASGLFFPHPPGDVLSVQIGAVIAVSDMEFLARMKTAPREVVTGEGASTAVEKVRTGPDGIMGVPGGNTEFATHNLDPRVDRYVEAINYCQRQWAQYRHVDPEWMGSSTGITGAAKEVERASIIEDQYRAEQVWREAEQDLVEVAADVDRVGRSTLSVSSPEVRVDYRYLQSRQNDLQEAQSVALLSALGATAVTKWMAQRDGITVEEARERLDDHLEERKTIIESWRVPTDVSLPPGLDSIGQQVLQ